MPNPDLKSVKITFAAWQALTHICAETGEPRTKALTRIILEAKKQQAAQRQKGSEA